MSISKFGQGAEFDEWSRKIHDIMDEMQKRSFVYFRDSGTWQPATNIYEARDAYYICVELAGVHARQVDIECVDRSCLTITGNRAQPRPDEVQGPLSVHAMEIDEGPFRREIDLPQAIDVQRVEATYSEGYLWIKVPRTTTE